MMLLQAIMEWQGVEAESGKLVRELTQGLLTAANERTITFQSIKEAPISQRLVWNGMVLNHVRNTCVQKCIVSFKFETNQISLQQGIVPLLLPWKPGSAKYVGLHLIEIGRKQVQSSEFCRFCRLCGFLEWNLEKQRKKFSETAQNLRILAEKDLVHIQSCLPNPWSRT